MEGLNSFTPPMYIAMPGSGTGVGGRGAGAGQEWVDVGRALPAIPTPLPLELFHSAALNEEGVGRGDGACEFPEFHGNGKFSPCERKLWRRMCERSGAHFELSISGFPVRPSPPFTPPSLPSPEARTPHLHGPGSLKAPRAQRSQAGWAAPSLPFLILPHPPLPLPLEKPGDSGRGEAKRAAVCSGKASGSIAAVALSKLPQGRAGLRGGSGALSRGRVRASRPVLERCCSSPARQAPVSAQRQDGECNDGNRGGGKLQGRAPGWRGGSGPGGFARAVMRNSRRCCSRDGHWRDSGFDLSPPEHCWGLAVKGLTRFVRIFFFFLTK